MKRRDFIRNTSLVALGAMVAPSFSFKPFDMKMFGLQLYTVRDDIQKDPAGTLRQISEIGYNHLEPYGFDGKFFGIGAKDFRKMAEDLGMRLTSTHTCITLDNADEFIEQAEVAGLEYLVLPSSCGRPLDTEEDCKVFAGEMNQIGEKCTKAGMKLGYHNHDMEFRMAGEKMLFDHLLALTEPEKVFFQPDFYFFAKAGIDPLPYFDKFPGRFLSWHVKDITSAKETTYLGNGSIDFKKIFKHAEKAGLKYFYVEQEQYVNSPLQDIRKSYDYLQENLM